MANLAAIRESVYRGDIGATPRLVRQALDEGIAVKTALYDGLMAAMAVIGGKFKNNEIFIPEVLISAKAMHAGMKILEPHFIKCNIKPLGRVVIGTVKGDLHDIGKNIVVMMLKGAGFEIEDLGIDVHPKRFAEAAKANKAQIIAMSSLVTTSMNSMAETIQLLTSLQQRSGIKVIVGGAPVTKEFADRIGADGYAEDAASAVDMAKSLLRS